jgi:2-polyprenyl-3-methyl-5-hydroxy-6-metoxy-1,4-benzoquinol methylase
MNCYLCESTSFRTRKGQVRDAPDLKILECTHCGLVTLSSLEHIQSGFYEESGMHGADPTPMDTWLKDTDWDDQRRFDMLKPILPNKKLLDFGCGAGGFLNKAQHLAGTVAGIELERRVREHWNGQITIYPDFESAGEGYNLITAFHVVEHLPDPRAMLKTLAKMLTDNGGRMVIEVPSSEDALLTLYDSDPFQRFTYWSQHLFLFNAETLRCLAIQAGLRVVSIQQFQRYPLSNHLYWLCCGLPGGHQRWSFLDTPAMTEAYSTSLAAVGKCDTLIAYLERNQA